MVTVVKLGGRSIETHEGRAKLAARLAALRQTTPLVVVHGGGAQVTAALAAAGIEARFVNGLRVTDEKTLEVAEPVFTYIGKLVAYALTVAGSDALAVTGRDAGLLRGVVKDAALGRVGIITAVRSDLLMATLSGGVTPVIGPIAVDEHGALNVNADEVASAVAKALRADELLLLTDVPHVRNAQGGAISLLTAAQARALIADGTATGGMIPKIQGALDALGSGVQRVRVLDEPGLTALAKGEPAGTTFTA